MNTTEHLKSGVVKTRSRSRFDPLRALTPDTLAAQLDAFEAGYLREAVETWDAIEKRDDLLKAVIPKRKKSVSRHGWEVIIPKHIPAEQKAEAALHKQALENFYRNLSCTSAVDTNERGAFKLLVRQMMDAIGKRYAVHEIVWNPRHESGLTAEFRFVPLSYFENTTGKLRFLKDDGALEGQPLEPGAWLVTAGDGLMVASSVAYMYKRLTVADWVAFSQRNGTPRLVGITNDARDSEGWNAFLDSIGSLLSGNSIVTNSTEKVSILDMSQGNQTPFPTLADRMDRMMAALWRGADLSTISREHGYGASLQDREACLLEEDDCELISETLNDGVDTWVIRYLFGKDAKPLARVRVLPQPRECSEYDLRVDQFLTSIGAPVSTRDLLERYGRELPEPGEAIVERGLPARSSNYPTTHASMNNERDTSTSRSSRGDEALTESSNLESRTAHIDQSVLTSATTSESLANTCATHPFSLLQDDWIQISPLGDFPHGQGIQRVDAEAITNLTRQFNSLLAKLGRFFAGVPFYVGHPDVPGLSRDYPDRKAYGWVTALDARDCGLAAKVKWSNEGRALLEEGHYKFLSPYWEAEEIAAEHGRKIYRPKRLISVGLTNQPNIPVLPLANEGCSSRGNETGDLTNATAQSSATNGEISSLLTSTATIKENLANVIDSLHTTSLTNDLGLRNSKRGRQLANSARIRELVSEKMALGNSYDEAWSNIKEQHPALFEQMVHPQN